MLWYNTTNNLVFSHYHTNGASVVSTTTEPYTTNMPAGFTNGIKVNISNFGVPTSSVGQMVFTVADSTISVTSFPFELATDVPSSPYYVFTANINWTATTPQVTYTATGTLSQVDATTVELDLSLANANPTTREELVLFDLVLYYTCLLYTSPSPRD